MRIDDQLIQKVLLQGINIALIDADHIGGQQTARKHSGAMGMGKMIL